MYVDEDDEESDPEISEFEREEETSHPRGEL